MLPDAVKETALTIVRSKKTWHLTNWPNIATKFARRGTVRSLLLSDCSNWRRAGSATQRAESCMHRSLGDSGTPGCSASNVAGLRQLLGSCLHCYQWKRRPTCRRPPLKTATEHCSRWVLRSFSCRRCRCRSKHRQEQQRQPWAPDTQDQDPAVPVVKNWAIWNLTSHDCNVVPGSLSSPKRPVRMTIWWVRLSHLGAALPSGNYFAFQ